MDSEQALDTAVCLEAYRFFLDQGRPPVPAEVAARLGTQQASVEDSLRRLADAHVVVLAPGTPYISAGRERCPPARQTDVLRPEGTR